MQQHGAALRLTEYWPRRYTLVLLSFGAVFICYMDRVNISVAIIPMSIELGWDPATQGTVLSAFFLGYLVTQVIGGRLADRFGGKVVLGIGVLSWSLFTMLTPFAAFAGFSALLFARVGMGIGEGVTFPSIYSLFGRWLPNTESARAIGVIFSAIPLGSVLALLLTPVIVIHWGWPWAFYSFGAVGLVWWWFWHTRVTAIPNCTDDWRARTKCDRVEPERVTGGTDITRTAQLRAGVGHHRGPFLHQLGRLCAAGLDADVHHKRPRRHFASVGLFAVIPSLCSFLFLNVAGWFADRLIKHGWEVTTARKTMQTIGFGGAATTLMFVGYIHDAPAAIALMSLGSILGACAVGGFGVNHLDIAPRYAGVLMGLSNTAGTIPGIIGVYVSGLILSYTNSWTLVFQVAAGIYLFGMVFYLIFASGKRLFD